MWQLMLCAILILVIARSESVVGSRAYSGTRKQIARAAPSYAILDDIRAQQDCVKTPAEYVEAFQQRQSRCVDPDLMCRVSASPKGGTISDVILNVTAKPVFFWGGSEALERAMRIGYPLTIGDFTVNNRQNYSSLNFQGINEISNGQAFLSAIGWDPQYIDITSVFSLYVLSKKQIKNLVRGQKRGAIPYNINMDAIQPTWDAVRHFLMYTFHDMNLPLQNAAFDILKENSIWQLTGCPPGCAYTLDDFPSANVTAPIITHSRDASGACPIVANATSMPPGGIDLSSSLCKQTWKDKMAIMTASINGSCSPLQALNSVHILKDNLSITPDSTEQALWIRAYLAQGCNGGFYSLFSGNGWTYDGIGGLISGMQREYILSPFNANKVPATGKASIFFCVNGLNGGHPDSNGRCPPPS